MRGALTQIRKKADGEAPKGRWPGKWSGYNVTFETSEGTFVGESRSGIRGCDDCMVEVSDDGVTFETTKRSL